MNTAALYALLAALAAGAYYAVWRSHRSEKALRRGLQALQTTIQFLEALNRLAPDLSGPQLQQQLIQLLQQLLKPFHIHSRLWIYNTGWKTLQGLGEHPDL